MTRYKNIERARIEFGLTREALARKLGVTSATLRGWEIGREPIPSDCLLCMAELFDCSVDFLLGRGTNTYYSSRFAS